MLGPVSVPIAKRPGRLRARRRGQNPGWICDEGDGILEGALAGGVQHCVHRWADLTYPTRQASAVTDRDAAKIRTRSWSGADAAPMTCRPCETASCVAIIPTEPAALRTRMVSPRATLSCLRRHRGLRRSGQGGGGAPAHPRRLGRPRRGKGVLAVAAETGQEGGDLIPYLHPGDGGPPSI